MTLLLLQEKLSFLLVVFDGEVPQLHTTQAVIDSLLRVQINVQRF